MNTQKHVVLAFSGGLDTSFCVPYLMDQGYLVTTVFVDSGGVSAEEKTAIRQRALSLGAQDHREINIGDQLWDQIVTPMTIGGFWYQQSYPLLCSDRYLIVASCLAVCDELNTPYFAHGCTGMGNDQVRFDVTVHCLGEYKVLSPIREIQKQAGNVRDYEIEFLQSKGFEVSNKASRYSVNENLLGVTISGGAIDQWQAPEQDSYVLTQPPHQINAAVSELEFTFEQGKLIALNGDTLNENYTGAMVLQQLNEWVGKYGIGRSIYTGDTTIGLKGRIVFEAPGIFALQAAHDALEQAVLSKSQNRFKSSVAKQWTELVYEGLFHEPLKDDLEAFLYSSQKQVNGTVTLQLAPGQCTPIAVESAHILKNDQSVYAQSADWSIEEAMGFIKLFGQSTTLAAKLQGDK